MITHVKIQCPCCQQNCEIFLSNNATFIILNCPECAKPLVYHNQTCAPLSKKQILRIRKAHPDLRLGQVLEEHSYGVSSQRHSQVAQRSTARCPVHVESSVCAASNRPCISKDDVVNLRIELATCDDSRDFISKM